MFIIVVDITSAEKHNTFSVSVSFEGAHNSLSSTNVIDSSDHCWVPVLLDQFFFSSLDSLISTASTAVPPTTTKTASKQNTNRYTPVINYEV